MQSLRVPGAATARAASHARAAPISLSSASASRRRDRLAPPARFNAGGKGDGKGDGGGSNNNPGDSNAGPVPTVALRLGASADAATLSMPLPPSAARRLEGELRALHATLRAKQEAVESGERPKRWPVMEFAFPSADAGGDAGGESAAVGGALALQLYCNPNAYSSAFDAKVLVRIECVGSGAAGLAAAGLAAAPPPPVRMTGEARLTDLQGTLEVYWDEQKQQQQQK